MSEENKNPREDEFKNKLKALKSQANLEFNKESKAWVHYTVFDGLADNRVLDIALDGDYVWFGTPKGVTLFYWNDPHRVD